jgi:carboxypeptidase C (cathepsin A)
MGAPIENSIRPQAWRRWWRRLAIVLAMSLGVAVLAAPGDAHAQRPERNSAAPRQQPGESPGAKPAATLPALPQDAVTQHEATLDGKKFSYTARAGSINLTNSEGAKQAQIFYVAYTRDGENKAARPITFALNGGPGASAAYLDMGALGPRILDFGNGRSLPRQRATLIQNPDSWLDLTDLVFIDPVGTGYSIPMVGGEAAQKEFYGVSQDLQALGAVVRRLLDKLDRFGSPVYLVGESYGGFRAARLPLTLANEEGIAVSGTIMISPVLDFSLMGGDDLNPLPWALELPSLAAVNLERQNALTPQALKPAERFALGDYLSSLVAPIGKTTAATPIDAKIASLIGIPESIVTRWNGRVPTGIFIKAIHHNEGEIVSRYDGSVAGPDADPSAYVARHGDPILEGLTAPLTSGFIAYLRDDLRFKTDRRYVLLSGDVGRHWQWGNRGPASAVSATDDLARAMALNPALKVMIAHGMTDLVTPYMASRYAVDHLPATIARQRIMLTLYPGGHMMYLRPGSRAALHADAKRLFSLAE